MALGVYYKISEMPWGARIENHSPEVSHSHQEPLPLPLVSHWNEKSSNPKTWTLCWFLPLLPSLTMSLQSILETCLSFLASLILPSPSTPLKLFFIKVTYKIFVAKACLLDKNTPHSPVITLLGFSAAHKLLIMPSWNTLPSGLLSFLVPFMISSLFNLSTMDAPGYCFWPLPACRLFECACPWPWLSDCYSQSRCGWTPPHRAPWVSQQYNRTPLPHPHPNTQATL